MNETKQVPVEPKRSQSMSMGVVKAPEVIGGGTDHREDERPPEDPEQPKDQPPA